jgi:hypothetical protein
VSETAPAPPSWNELSQRLPTGPRREAFRSLEVPVAVAAEVVDALRRARARGGLWSCTPRQAGVGLLFAGVRVLALLGAERAELRGLVETLWELNRPDPPTPRRSP